MTKKAVFAAACWCCALLPAAGAQIQPATLIMVDANDRVVGPVLEPGVNFSLVGLDVNGHAIVASVSRMAFVGAIAAGFGVFFTSTDCTGQAYIEWPTGGPLTLEAQAIVGPNSALYVGPVTTGQPLNYASALLPNAPCAVTAGTANTIPGNFVANLTPPFVPPFRVTTAPASFLASIPAVSPAGLAVLAALIGLGGLLLLGRWPSS